MTTTLEKVDAAFALARRALERDVVQHEQRDEVEHEGGALEHVHRLVVNGRPGPWVSRHAIAAHGPYRASTREAWAGEYPRVFFVLPVCEHEPPPTAEVPPSPRQDGFHPSDPGAVEGSRSGPAGGVPSPSAGTGAGPATAGELLRALRVLLEAIEAEGDLLTASNDRLRAMTEAKRILARGPR